MKNKKHKVSASLPLIMNHPKIDNFNPKPHYISIGWSRKGESTVLFRIQPRMPISKLIISKLCQ